MRQVLLYLLAMWKSALCSHKYRTMSSRPCGSDCSSKTRAFNKNLKAGGPERSRVGLGDMVDIRAMADEGSHNAEVPSSCGTPECCHYRHSSPSPTPSTTPTPSSSQSPAAHQSAVAPSMTCPSNFTTPSVSLSAPYSVSRVFTTCR